MLTRQTFVGPWAGLPVAWTEDDEFDERTYRADVARCCEAGLPGVYTGGTSGEFYVQDIDEFERIARATVEECHRHDKPAMIGCTATSTRGAVRRAALAAQIGADAVQVALPFWTEIHDTEVTPFFRAVADAAEGLPISIYETTWAKKRLTVKQHYEIHNAVPQYLMVKATRGTIGDTAEGCQAISGVVNVFVSEHRWCELGPRGAVGSCSSVAYWNPRIMLLAWQYLRERNWSALQLHCERVGAVFAGLFAAWSERGFTESAIDRIGARSNGFLQTSLQVRGPYASPTEADIATLRRLYEQHYPAMLTLGRQRI